MRIKSIKKLSKKNDRYDLTINSTHNFYANGILIHNTSFRSGYTKTIKVLSKWKSFINSILPIFLTEKWEYLNGTRRVVLFEEDSNKTGFHGSEQFRFDVFEKIKPHLVKGMEVFGEIYGWANGSTIMAKHSTDSIKDKAFQKKYGKEVIYKYGCQEGETGFMIYRISLTAEDGTHIDFSPAQIQDWCEKRGFNSPKIVYPSFIYSGDSQSLKDLVENLTERPEVLTEDYTDPSHVSEGIVLRCDFGGLTPLFYKNKSWIFKIMEGIAKEDDVDLEDIS